MRDIHRPLKQPAQRANSKTPPSHSKPPSQKIAQLQYSKAEVKVIKRAKHPAAAQPPLPKPHTYSLEGKQKSRKTESKVPPPPAPPKQQPPPKQQARLALGLQ